MLSDIRIYLGLLLGCSAVIYAASYMHALTNAGGGVNNGVPDRAEFLAVFNDELDYCEENADDLDCQCFANIAGVVIASDTGERVPGATYPDLHELARMQAEDSC